MLQRLLWTLSSLWRCGASMNCINTHDDYFRQSATDPILCLSLVSLLAPRWTTRCASAKESCGNRAALLQLASLATIREHSPPLASSQVAARLTCGLPIYSFAPCARGSIVSTLVSRVTGPSGSLSPAARSNQSTPKRFMPRSQTTVSQAHNMARGYVPI